MAVNSILAAEEKWDALTAALFANATRPAVYFGEAPQTDAAGAQQRPPYVVISHGGQAPEFQSDFGGPEEGEFTLEIFDLSMGDVGAAAKAAKWNGQIPSARAGFDNGTLVIDAPYYFRHVVRTAEEYAYAGFDYQSRRVHVGRLTYSYLLELRAAG